MACMTTAFATGTGTATRATDATGANRATHATRAITLDVADYRMVVEAGALVVDIRSRVQRERQGVLAGALAVDARPVIDYLDPRSATPLASVTEGREVLLVSEDGLDAELFAWELHSRGVTGVRAVDGGHRALRSARQLGLLTDAGHLVRERTAISAH